VELPIDIDELPAPLQRIVGEADEGERKPLQALLDRAAEL